MRGGKLWPDQCHRIPVKLFDRAEDCRPIEGFTRVKFIVARNEPLRRANFSAHSLNSWARSPLVRDGMKWFQTYSK